MKILVTITQDIIDKSRWCGHDPSICVSSNCALAVAINELVPNAQVKTHRIRFFDSFNQCIGFAENSNKMIFFIETFDLTTAHNRDKFIGTELLVEIPHEVIEYWYQGAVDKVNKILNKSKSLKLANET